MRLFPSGGVDPPFDANTVNWTGPTGFVNALVRLPDGKFLVGGDCMLGTRAVLARINADGTVDGTFSPLQDTGGNCAAYAIAVLPDGKIAVGGDFTYLANPIPDAPNLALLDASGHPYTPVYAEGGTVFALAAQPDGNVLIGGAFTDVNSAAPARLARMSGNGVVDESFNPDPNATVRAIGLRADGKAFVGGDFTAIGADASQHLALLDGSGAVDPVFSLDVDDSVYAIAVQPDGRVAFGGAFTHADAFPHNFVARASVIDPALFELKPRFVAGGLRTIIWKQQGAGPVPASPPRLSLSLDGIAYTAIGPMTYDAGAQQWSYDDFAPPLDQLMFLRVDVQTAGGGSIETVLPTFDADRIFADGFDP
jgi:uncharacterized delta-60 repeat protein